MASTSAKTRALQGSRSLNVHDQFASHAAGLVSAAKEGAAIHATGNISESGGPFESEFRSLFEYALPSTFLTTAGYFFGHEFDLSGQADFLLCDETDVLKLPPKQGMVTGYVPYRSVKVMGQLKNSFGTLADALEQSSAGLKKWKGMADRYPSATRHEPLGIVVIARGGTDKQVRKIVAKFKGRLPAYIFLVEKGLLYGRQRATTLVFDNDAVFFDDQGNGGPLALLESADTTQSDSGRMLMWLFFAILSHVVAANNTTLNRIVERVKELNPIKYAAAGRIEVSTAPHPPTL